MVLSKQVDKIDIKIDNSIFEAKFKNYAKTFITCTHEDNVTIIENSKMTLYSEDCADSGITTNIVNVKNSFFKLNSTSAKETNDMGIFTFGVTSS